MSVQTARVILLAGPSGSGKSYIARRTGLPVLCLDDFYKDAHDSTLPRRHGAIDWESPKSWDAKAAVEAIAELAHEGATNVPLYDIAQSRAIDRRPFHLAGSPLFIAEGIFAAEVVTACSELGLVADALALKRNRIVTFTRRLVRDLAEHRKPPALLVRRGVQLLRNEPVVLTRQRRLGCRIVNVAEFDKRVQRLKSASRTPV